MRMTFQLRREKEAGKGPIGSQTLGKSTLSQTSSVALGTSKPQASFSHDSLAQSYLCMWMCLLSVSFSDKFWKGIVFCSMFSNSTALWDHMRRKGYGLLWQRLYCFILEHIMMVLCWFTQQWLGKRQPTVVELTNHSRLGSWLHTNEYFHGS